MDNIKKAILEQENIDEVRETADQKLAKTTKDFIDLEKKYNIAREQLDDIHKHFKPKIKDIKKRG